MGHATAHHSPSLVAEGRGSRHGLLNPWPLICYIFGQQAPSPDCKTPRWKFFEEQGASHTRQPLTVHFFSAYRRPCSPPPPPKFYPFLFYFKYIHMCTVMPFF